MTRTDAVRALLGSLFDYLENAEGALRVMRLGDIPGETPSAWKECPSCGGRGTFGKAHRQCAACAGRGNVKVDQYTAEQVGTSESKISSAKPSRIDAELRALARNEAMRRGYHIDDPFAWEFQRRRYEKSGSYAELRGALRALQREHENAYLLVLRCIVHRAAEPSHAAEAVLDEAVQWIADYIPGGIRVPRWVTAETPRPGKGRWANGFTQERRNAEILRLYRDGMTHAEIGRDFGLTRRAVGKVIAAGTAT